VTTVVTMPPQRESVVAERALRAVRANSSSLLRSPGRRSPRSPRSDARVARQSGMHQASGVTVSTGLETRGVRLQGAECLRGREVVGSAVQAPHELGSHLIALDGPVVTALRRCRGLRYERGSRSLEGPSGVGFSLEIASIGVPLWGRRACRCAVAGGTAELWCQQRPMAELRRRHVQTI